MPVVYVDDKAVRGFLNFPIHFKLCDQTSSPLQLAVLEFLDQNKICYAEIEQTFDTFVRKRREATEVRHVTCTCDVTWPRVKTTVCFFFICST